jgi:hypothetical protein
MNDSGIIHVVATNCIFTVTWPPLSGQEQTLDHVR